MPQLFTNKFFLEKKILLIKKNSFKKIIKLKEPKLKFLKYLNGKKELYIQSHNNTPPTLKKKKKFLVFEYKKNKYLLKENLNNLIKNTNLK